MILGSGRTPGKVILFGEHAVVYGRPALAVPVTQVQAEAVVEPGEAGAGLTIVAADLGETIVVRDAPADHPLAAAARLTLVKFGLDDPDWRVTVRSTIPIASGMGSGAAVSAAIVRALVEAANSKLQIANRQVTESAVLQFAVCSLQSLSALVYEVERLHHGTPSGIDNTVVVYGQPVYFRTRAAAADVSHWPAFHVGYRRHRHSQPDQGRGGRCAAGMGAGAATLRVAV